MWYFTSLYMCHSYSKMFVNGFQVLTFLLLTTTKGTERPDDSSPGKLQLHYNSRVTIHFIKKDRQC